jgi:hypothetical protein
MATETIPLPLEQQLSWRLHRLGKLTDAATAAAYANELGLGVAEARALAAIGSFEPLSVNDLAAHAHLDKAQASRAAQMLVERGSAIKAPSETDARLARARAAAHRPPQPRDHGLPERGRAAATAGPGGSVDRAFRGRLRNTLIRAQAL